MIISSLLNNYPIWFWWNVSDVFVVAVIGIIVNILTENIIRIMKIPNNSKPRVGVERA